MRAIKLFAVLLISGCASHQLDFSGGITDLYDGENSLPTISGRYTAWFNSSTLPVDPGIMLDARGDWASRGGRVSLTPSVAVKKDISDWSPYAAIGPALVISTSTDPHVINDVDTVAGADFRVGVYRKLTKYLSAFVEYRATWAEADFRVSSTPVSSDRFFNTDSPTIDTSFIPSFKPGQGRGHTDSSGVGHDIGRGRGHVEGGNGSVDNGSGGNGSNNMEKPKSIDPDREGWEGVLLFGFTYHF
jgi:hypothetical protein